MDQFLNNLYDFFLYVKKTNYMQSYADCVELLFHTILVSIQLDTFHQLNFFHLAAINSNSLKC